MYPPSDKLFNAPQFGYEFWLDQGVDQPSTIHAGLPSVVTGATQTPYFEPTTARSYPAPAHGVLNSLDHLQPQNSQMAHYDHASWTTSSSSSSSSSSYSAPFSYNEIQHHNSQILGEGLWPSHHVAPTHHTLPTEFQPVAHNLSPFPAQTTRFNHDHKIWRPHQYDSQYSYHQPAVPFPPSSAYPGPPSSNLGYHPNTNQRNARQRSEPQPQWLHHGPHPMNYSVSISTLQGRFQPRNNDVSQYGNQPFQSFPNQLEPQGLINGQQSESAASTDETPFCQNDCHIPQNQYSSDIMRRRTEARLTSKRQVRQQSRMDRQLDATGSSASPTSSNHPSLSLSPTDPARVHQPSSIDNMANIQAGSAAAQTSASPSSTTRTQQSILHHQRRSALLSREAERQQNNKSTKAPRAGTASSEGNLIERRDGHEEADGGSRRTSEGQARRSKITAPQPGPSKITPTQKIGMKFQQYDPFEVRNKTSKAGGKRKADEDVPEEGTPSSSSSAQPAQKRQRIDDEPPVHPPSPPAPAPAPPSTASSSNSSASSSSGSAGSALPRTSRRRRNDGALRERYDTNMIIMNDRRVLEQEDRDLVFVPQTGLEKQTKRRPKK